ncbi:MAG: response regulator [Pseudomonadota bacterium]
MQAQTIGHEAEQPLRPVNVLVIDDDEVDVVTVRRAFERKRIANRIYVAKDGIEALDLLRTGEITRPILILLDINMPRMNGLEFLRELRKDHDHQSHVVFILTTSSNQSDIFDAYELNVAGYMLKTEVGDGFVDAIGLIESYWRIVEFPLN